MLRRFTAALVLLLGTPMATAAAATLTTYRVAPSDVDPAIERYNDRHVVVFDREARPTAKLLLFMPGVVDFRQTSDVQIALQRDRDVSY